MIACSICGRPEEAERRVIEGATGFALCASCIEGRAEALLARAAVELPDPFLSPSVDVETCRVCRRSEGSVWLDRHQSGVITCHQCLATMCEILIVDEPWPGETAERLMALHRRLDAESAHFEELQWRIGVFGRDRSTWPPDVDEYRRWVATYPAADVEPEIRRLAARCRAYNRPVMDLLESVLKRDVAAAIAERAARGASRERLRTRAMLGLWIAARKLDPSSPAPFHEQAMRVIREALDARPDPPDAR